MLIQNLLTVTNLEKHGEEIVNVAINAISESPEIAQAWNANFCENSRHSGPVKEIMDNVVERYVSTAAKQFRKNVKDKFKSKKKLAHRKTVFQKTEKAKHKSVAVTMKDIYEDTSSSKEMSHLQLRYNCKREAMFFMSRD